MTPEQHWAAGEELLALAKMPRRVVTHFGNGTVVLSAPMEYHDESVAMAQAHFTAALAAATLLAGAAGYDAARDRLADAVLGVQR